MKKAVLLFLFAFLVQSVSGQQQPPAPTSSSQTQDKPPARTPRPQQQSQSFDLTEYGVRIEPDRRLIVVMVSLEAAGLETPLTASGNAFREQLKKDLSSLNPDLQQKLKNFLAQYRRRHPNDTPAQIAASFVSLAYALSPVPELQDPPRSADLPADLLEVFDYAPLAREFYRRSGIGANLENYVKEYQKAGDAMRPSATVMARDLLEYLRTRPQTTYLDRVRVEGTNAKGKKKLEKTEVRERERRFFIVPDLLAPAGTINFRNIGDDYYVVVPPNTNLSASEARRAFLQFVVDPLVLQNAKDIAALRDGIKALVEERRKVNPDISPDIYIAVVRSMVAAADARQIEFVKTQAATAEARRRIDLAQGDDAKRAVSAELARFKAELADETARELSEAYERGAVLSFYFAEQLKGTEDSGFDIAGSFRDFILSLDPTKEANRLAQFAEARNRAVAAREKRRKEAATQNVTVAELSSREKVLKEKLEQVEQIIKSKEYDKAEEQLRALMSEYPGDARILYTRGRVASLWAVDTFPENRIKRLEEAIAHYSNAIRNTSTEIEPALVSLCYVALGRIYEYFDEETKAAESYNKAIAIGDVAGGAYKEAAAAKEKLTKKPQ
jgi:tetratricopeptide (TPR) repeat protein